MTGADGCEGPRTTALPCAEDLAAAAGLLATLAHPTRLLVLLALARRGPLSVSELMAVAQSEQSAMSHQLRLLRQARLVRGQRRGRRVVYALHDDHVAHIVQDAVTHAVDEMNAEN